MNPIAEDILMHYGVSKLDGAPGRGSGRYPLGSGENPNQRYGDLLSRYESLQKEGMKETEIAEAMGMKTTQLRAQLSLAKAERRASLVAKAQELRAEGNSLNEIAEKMGFANDSSVRSLLNENTKKRMNQAKVTAAHLKQMVDEKGMIDVGNGVERELNVSREKLNQALQLLSEEGYETYGGGVPQVTNKGKQTNIKVLCPPGTEHKEIYNFDNVHSVTEYDKILVDDGTKVRKAFEYPSSMDSKRLQIVYAEQGGELKDGVIEIRRGVPDLSLGESHYAQVRILVDGTHYLKGMAVYADDLPDGIDVRFNTNKKEGTPALGTDKNHSVLKPISKDPDNPFGSLIKEHGGQSYYMGADGKEHLSLINKRAEEGDWGDWSDHLPSQFLAKQPMPLINRQLNLAMADKNEEFETIMSLTNPTIKKQMLYTFAEECDSAALHLQAAALPRQKYQVILPLTSISDNQVYAPNYRDGEKVALIRYPHGGTFEIPILTVNNKISEGKKVIGTSPKDAIGISKKVADRLSGADFDGDTVMVIPTGGKTKIVSTPPLTDLEGFDPKIEYGPDSTDRPYKRMKATQLEMGKISNLITDMTLLGATDEEKAKAVKHSMVVIDAEKHNLDYKRSEKENDIAALKRKYQGHIGEDGRYHEGAATLISRAKSQVSVPKRQGSPIINEDGSLSYKTASPEKLMYVDKKTGKTITRMQKSRQMEETSDAYTLVSKADTSQERAYAEYANKMKALANTARKEYLATKEIPYSASAHKVYKNEVDSLDSQLNLALLNAPRERQAQLIANSVVKAKREENPGMSSGEIKKASQVALTEARLRVGAARRPITFTDREWEAIQAGAISKSMLQQIAKFADKNELKERAMPRATRELSEAKKARIKAFKASGYTNDQIARFIGCSVSTVNKYS
jgi:DNA-directed RNA polymerase specialized sigma24 family protein